MPLFDIAGETLSLPFNVALVDTNVLVGIIDQSDQHHEEAVFFYENENNYTLLVTPPVIFEAFAILVKNSGLALALALPVWLLQPGNGVMLCPSLHSSDVFANALQEQSTWMRQHQLDYVDAYLMEAAHRIGTLSNMKFTVPIVTFDRRDFAPCFGKGYKFSLHFPNGNEKLG